MAGYSIEVHNLTKRYHRLTAIENVSFNIEHGEVVGFLGPNGAGKSTTMRILCGIIPASSGVARIGGLSVATRIDDVKRLIGYMPENNPLPEDMRVLEYLRFRARLKEIPAKRLQDRLQEVLELCDLNRKTSRKVIGSLSKGFRQRVGIADAILAEPQVIIMDEPSIGLDPHQVLAIRDLIESFRGKMTVIISSHVLAEVELSCDRVIIINHGRIVASGNAASLRREFINKVDYRIEMKGDLGGLGSLLKEIEPGMTWVAMGKPDSEGFLNISLSTPRTEDLSERILEKFQQQPGIRLRAFNRVEAKLEDIFLSATRRSWKEVMTAAKRNDQDTENAST